MEHIVVLQTYINSYLVLRNNMAKKKTSKKVTKKKATETKVSELSSKKKATKKKAAKEEAKTADIVEVKLEEQKSETKETKKEKHTEKKPKEIIKAMFARERVLAESTDEARNLYNKSAYGQVLDDGRVQLSLQEALFLLEKGKITISDGRIKSMKAEDFIKKARKAEPNFWIRYCVFKDMRNRGYIIKTALKFGADFRVYDRGIKPGEDHARWIIFPVHEGETLTWYEFAAKNRVAHSTKKRLMMGIVDDEGDVTYYEIKWMRP